MVVGFLFARPRVEALAIRTLQAGASQRGWTATVGTARLRPWLTLDLRDVALGNESGWRVEAREVSVSPGLSWHGLIGRAALARLSTVSVYLPVGLQIDVRPATWAIDSSNDRPGPAVAAVEMARSEGGPGATPPIALIVTTGRDVRIDARFVGAPLSDLVQVLRDGCPVARLGTIDGDGQVVRGGRGPVEVRLKGRARGLAFASAGSFAGIPEP